MKGHKKSESKESRAVDGGGGGGGGEGHSSPRFARRYFFSLFSATVELGPRLDEIPKNVYEGG